MAERVELVQFLTDRGQPVDQSESDAQLEGRIAAIQANEAAAAAPPLDRAGLEQFLQARGIAYAPDATDEQLNELVGATRDADHARFLQTYVPVLTRLPAAVGTSPEQPAEQADESEAQPDTGAEAQAGATDAAASADEPAADLAQTAAPEPVEGDPAAASDAEPVA